MTVGAGSITAGSFTAGSLTDWLLTDSSLAGCMTPQQIFARRIVEWGTQVAFREKRLGIWRSITWAKYGERAAECAYALAALGVRRGEVVSLLAENRPEWLYVDLGAQCFRMIGNGIYPTSSPAQVAYVINDSRTRVLVVDDDEQLDKVLAIRDQCPTLTRIVVIDERGLAAFSDPQVMSFAALLDLGRAERARDPTRFAREVALTDAADLAYLVYTSGTTGAPKGAMITNANMMFQLAAGDWIMPMNAGDRTLSFLPLCHIAERVTTGYQPLRWGNLVHFPESSGTIFNDLREVSPHHLFAPPRFWEKLYSQVALVMDEAVPIGRWAYRHAIDIGAQAAECRLAGRPIPPSLVLKQRLFAEAVLANVRRFVGLAEVRTAITGAAPVSPDLLRWFMALGIDLAEAYGMTETSGMTTATPAGGLRLGYAGLPGPHCEVRLGEADELLVRGPNVFAGYWEQPELTRATIDSEGWLHTGDVATIDAAGYVGIRDRLKDIIITSGGKNVTPSTIENKLKVSPYVSDAVVIGEARHYLTCLVMLDHENVAQYAQSAQVPFTDFASLARAPQIVQLIAAEVERLNAGLARVEQLKDFRIIDVVLTPEDEELTPTMKLKRRVVATRYAALIESMYGESMDGLRNPIDQRRVQ
ncbi:MAG: AMP-binding protein [Burkholderiales bacterium]